MNKPFAFKTRLNLVELLGRTARNIDELRSGISDVSGSSIYHHTHRFLQQHHYLYPEPPNDFAFWVAQALRLDDLGERLASIDTVKCLRINDLRDRYLGILNSAAKTGDIAGSCRPGEEFHFMSCRTFVLPTPFQATNLQEFNHCLGQVSINSIYYHMFEARLRLGQDTNDFSLWLSGLGHEALALNISRLDPYTITLEGLRQRIRKMVNRHENN